MSGWLRADDLFELGLRSGFSSLRKNQIERIDIQSISVISKNGVGKNMWAYPEMGLKNCRKKCVGVTLKWVSQNETCRIDGLKIHPISKHWMVLENWRGYVTEKCRKKVGLKNTPRMTRTLTCILDWFFHL